MVSAKATGADVGADVKRRNVPVVEVSGENQEKQVLLAASEVDDKKEKKPVRCSAGLDGIETAMD